MEEWDTGVWLGAAGLVVSLAGFATAILEIRKTQHAAKATSEAVHQTLRGVAASRLGMDIVRMRRLADDFEDAAGTYPLDQQRSETVRRSLTEWRHLATASKTLVQQRFGNEHETIGLISASVENARAAKASIFDGGLSREDAKECLTAMEKALDGLSPLLEQLHVDVDEVDDAVE